MSSRAVRQDQLTGIRPIINEEKKFTNTLRHFFTDFVFYDSKQPPTPDFVFFDFHRLPFSFSTDFVFFDFHRLSFSFSTDFVFFDFHRLSFSFSTDFVLLIPTAPRPADNYFFSDFVLCVEFFVKKRSKS
jgi:hypothetical protein